MCVGNQARRVPHVHLKNYLITDQDQKMFLLVGIAIDGKKCGGICEILLVDEDKVMDVRSKGSDSRSIPSGMTPRPLIFLLGKNGVHRGGSAFALLFTTLLFKPYPDSSSMTGSGTFLLLRVHHNLKDKQNLCLF
uniref:Uncharacterized protein n=1 Tax=Ficedula albicollis TaxID=59894 RepID=A0A803V2K0_FICAL